MLALDLYLRLRGVKAIGKTAPEVVQLSAVLRSLNIFPVDVREDPRFRNPAGVALKISNFQALDPSYAGKGMENLSEGDVKTWDEWARRPLDLEAAAGLIRELAEKHSLPPETDEDEEYAAQEGRVLYRTHRRFERDRKLVQAKKDAVLSKTGRLQCEVCGFDSASAYGVDGVIDVHHIVPLHKLGESVTSLPDLALVCPTCHRVIHAHSPFITPTELRAKRQFSTVSATAETRVPRAGAR